MNITGNGNAAAYVQGSGNNVNVSVNIVSIPAEVFTMLQHSQEQIRLLQTIIESKDRTIDNLLQMLDKVQAIEFSNISNINNINNI